MKFGSILCFVALAYSAQAYPGAGETAGSTIGGAIDTTVGAVGGAATDVANAAAGAANEAGTTIGAGAAGGAAIGSDVTGEVLGHVGSIVGGLVGGLGSTVAHAVLGPLSSVGDYILSLLKNGTVTGPIFALLSGLFTGLQTLIKFAHENLRWLLQSFQSM